MTNKQQRYIWALAAYLCCVWIMPLSAQSAEYSSPSSSQAAPFRPLAQLDKLDGIWVVTGLGIDDFGGRNRWMSEWYINRNQLRAVYKGSLNNLVGNNQDWQIRNLRIGGGSLSFSIVQEVNYGYGITNSTVLNIQMRSTEHNVIYCDYVQENNAMGYITRTRGVLEMRPVVPLVSPDFATLFTGRWLNTGEQQTEGLPQASSFTNSFRVYQKDGLLMVENRTRNADNIEMLFEYFVTYAVPTGDGRLRMTLYSPKGGCLNPGCATVLDYTLTLASDTVLSGDFSGIMADVLILQVQGNVTFEKRQ